jgi:hypothetical protein
MDWHSVKTTPRGLKLLKHKLPLPERAYKRRKLRTRKK